MSQTAMIAACVIFGVLVVYRRKLHAFVYAMWGSYYVYILRNIILPVSGTHRKRRLASHFHCKVLTPGNAEAIITLNQDIPLTDLEQVIPYESARSLILKSPVDVVAYECACRQSRKTHCEPTQVCMVIGRPHTDFILKIHPGTSRRISTEEALDILKTAHASGNVHTAWFKDTMKGRFYALCNCCSCCCFGLDAMNRLDTPIVAPSGYVAGVANTVCAGCGFCADVCPFSVIEIRDHAAYIDPEKCMGCGVCVSQCPNQCLSLRREPSRGIPLDVRALAQAIPTPAHH